MGQSSSLPQTNVNVTQAFEHYSQAQAGLQQYFDLPLDLLCSLNREGRFQSASFSWVQLLGWRPTELEGQSWSEWIHPQDLQSSLLKLNSLLNHRPHGQITTPRPRKRSCFEHRFRHRDGSYRWLRWQLVTDDNSQQIVHGWIRDVTHEKVSPAEQFGFEREFLQLAQTMRDVFWIYDPIAEQQLYVSPSYEKVWERSCNSLYADPKSLQAAIHPEDRVYVKVALNKLCETAIAPKGSDQCDLEYRIQTPEGDIRWIHDRSFPLRDANGEMYRFIGVAEDITEQRQAEQSCDRLFQQISAQNQTLEQGITQRTTELRAIIDAVPDQIYVINRQSQRIDYCNRAFIESLGLTEREAVEGKTLDQCFAPERAQLLAQQNQQVLDQGTSFQAEECDQEGPRARHLDTLKIPLRDNDGEVYALVSSSRDITDFKVAEIKLQNSQALFRAIVEQAAVGISLVSPTGKFMEVNQKFCDLLGYDRQELMEMTFQEITDPHYLKEDLEHYRRLLAGEISSFSLEKCFIRKDQSLQWAALTVSGVYDEKGSMKFDIGVLQDINDRKLAEAEVLKSLEKERELNELKSRVISMISHEYRTPLTIICSSAELLERYGPQWEEARRSTHFERIQTSVQHLTELVNDVLFLNRAEADRLDFVPAPLDIVAFFQGLFPELQDAFESQSDRAHPLEVNYPQGNPHCYVDERLLRQIVTNLFSNALKYSLDDQPVQCDISCDDEQLVFSIRDQGIGIPSEEQPYLFDSFHRAANVGTIPGTGLGLSIVRKCVDVHGGDIQVESSEDQGTCFTVTLPTVAPPPAVKTTQASGQPPK